MTRWHYAVGSASILSLAAVFKLITIASGARLLYLRDPLLGLQNRVVLVCVATVEVVIACLVLLRSEHLWSVICVPVLSAEFLLYRAFTAAFSLDSHCPCLGNLSEWLTKGPLRCLPSRSVEAGVQAFLWGAALWLFVIGSAFCLQATKSKSSS